MFKSVIFDLDGTILNTLEDLTNASNYVCQQNGWPEQDMATIRTLVGHGIPNLVRSLAPTGGHSPLMMITAVQQFSQYYKAHNMDCTCPYPQVLELLQQLKASGITMGVYSNKQHCFCQKLVEYYFPDIFVYAQGKEDGVPLKPSVEGTERVLTAMGVDKATTLYVGDSDTDMETAQNAGLSACAVTWGFRDAAQLQAYNPTYMVDTPQAIVNIVLG